RGDAEREERHRPPIARRLAGERRHVRRRGGRGGGVGGGPLAREGLPDRPCESDRRRQADRDVPPSPPSAVRALSAWGESVFCGVSRRVSPFPWTTVPAESPFPQTSGSFSASDSRFFVSLWRDHRRGRPV